MNFSAPIPAQAAHCIQAARPRPSPDVDCGSPSTPGQDRGRPTSGGVRREGPTSTAKAGTASRGGREGVVPVVGSLDRLAARNGDCIGQHSPLRLPELLAVRGRSWMGDSGAAAHRHEREGHKVRIHPLRACHPLQLRHRDRDPSVFVPISRSGEATGLRRVRRPSAGADGRPRGRDRVWLRCTGSPWCPSQASTR